MTTKRARYQLTKVEPLLQLRVHVYALHVPDGRYITEQHHLLNRVSALIDEGRIDPPSQNLGEMTVENLKKAHALQESGTVIGKNVLSV